MLESRVRTRLKSQITEQGRVDILATEVLGYKLEQFHLEILQFAMRLQAEGGEGLLLAPRGFGKSTIGNVTLCIFLILCDPDVRILIASSTASKAEAFLREIKTHFEQNLRLKDLFGEHFRSDRWKQAEIFVLPRKRIAKEATLSAHGWSGAVVSKHYDVHIIDDLVNEDNARTKGQRQKLMDWYYMSLDPTLESDGWKLVIGTRYHPDDLYGHMIEQSKGEKMEDEDEPENPNATEKRTHLEMLVLKAIVDEGRGTERSLWEKVFPLHKLKRKRSRMGKLRFGAQFQNETDLMKGFVIKEEDIRYFLRDEIDVSTLKIFQGVDLAVGKKDTNDYFSLVTRGFDEYGKAYTLDVVHGRYSFREQMMIVLWKAGRTRDEISKYLGIPDLKVQEILKLFRGQHPTAKRQYRAVQRIGIESVAYQRVLPDTLIENVYDLPIIRIDQNVDKETRIQMFSPRFENHMEFLPADNSCDHLKEEALLFPEAEHDDILDAMEISNQVAAMVIDLTPRPEGEVSVRVFT